MERIWIEGQLLRHEADLDNRPHAVLQQTIVDLIDVREVVDRVAVLVFVVDADFVMQDGVKAHILEICYLLYRAQVVAIALAQRENGAPRTEHLFPEVWERV